MLWQDGSVHISIKGDVPIFFDLIDLSNIIDMFGSAWNSPDCDIAHILYGNSDSEMIDLQELR